MGTIQAADGIGALVTSRDYEDRKLLQEGKEVKLGGGFGGTSGYKFDDMEQEADDSKKRLEKLSRGGIDHDDDDLVR